MKTICWRAILLAGLLPVSLFAYTQNVSVVTQHNNNHRTGWNNNEMVLDHQLLQSNKFGCIGNFAVDDEVYAQPLVVRHLKVGNFTGAVLFVATVNNTLYAFNADDPSQPIALWVKSLNGNNERAPSINDLTDPKYGEPCGGNYHDFSGKFGIVGTPVIDTNTNTLYVATKTIDAQGQFHAYINAIDITSGGHRPGSPGLITAAVSGTGDGNVNGTLNYDAKYQNQRPALLMLNGIVYVASASHCDWGPYHGWILGYDAATLALKYTYNATPNGWAAGIWMAGQGPSVGEDGNIYFVTGNGTTSADNSDLSGGRSESLVKLSPKLELLDWFTPANYQYLDQVDLDYGCDGALIIPGTSLSVSGSKEGISYVVDQNRMGRFNATNSQVIDTIAFNPNREGDVHVHGSPVYANLASGEFVYGWTESFKVRQFAFDRVAGHFTKTFLQGSRNLDYGMPGAMLSVSSHGTDTASAILWACFPTSGNANQQVRPGTVAALNAANVSQPELWNSSNNVRDDVGKFSKFNSATVANGKLFVPTFSKNIKVYGKICDDALSNLTYANGEGLRADYYSNSNASDGFNNSTTVQLDAGINFNWGGGAPAANISSDVFKVKWTGKLQPLVSGNHTLFVTASDGVRLYINDQLLIDSWKDQVVTLHTATVDFDKTKQYEIRLEYYSNTNSAFISLQWNAAGVCREVIPASQLFPVRADCNSHGTGLLAKYYSDINPAADFPANPTTTTVVSNVDFDWGGGSPAGISTDHFKAQFSGYVQSLDAGKYTFYVTADDGVRVWIDNKLVIDAWRDQGATEYSTDIELKQCHKYAVRIEYYENGGDAVCKLAWSGPVIGKQPVPASQLYLQPDGPDMSGRSIVVYPNPVKGNTIYVSLNETIDASNMIRIFDTKGSVVSKEVIKNPEGNTGTVHVVLPRGFYLLSFYNNGKTFLSKFEVL